MTSIEHKRRKIFITGATGFIGQHLVAALSTKEYDLYILTRKAKHPFITAKNCTIINADINDAIILPEDIDIIFHCAGVVGHPNEMERVNVQGTKNIVSLAQKYNCLLVHLSSAGITGTTPEHHITEHTACNPHNDYELSKYKAEKIIVEAIQKGLRAHIVRPTTIIGDIKNYEKDSFFQLVKSMRSGLYKNIGNGIYNIIHINEVIHALELLINPNIATGDIYILNNTITYRKLDTIVKNIPPRIQHTTGTVPYIVAYSIACILTLWAFLTGRKNPLTFSRLRALTNTHIYSQEHIQTIVSFENFLPIEAYVQQVTEEYIQKGILF